jgi:integrase
LAANQSPSRRSVRLRTFATEALKRHREAQKIERRFACSKWIDNGLVFTSTIGTALDERNVRRSFKALLNKAELPTASRLASHVGDVAACQGVHPRVVMETLGHSQVSLTLDT